MYACLTLTACVVFFVDCDDSEIEYFDKLFSDNDLDKSFVQLLDQLQLRWDNLSNFARIKAACERTNKLPTNIRQKIGEMHSLEKIITFLCHCHYCSWFEIRVLELMADVAKDSKANQLIELFSQRVYSRTAVEVEVYFTTRYIGTTFNCLVTYKFNKLGRNITVKELLKDCQDMENYVTVTDGSIVPIADVKLDRCIEISLSLPIHYCYHAYNMYMDNFLKLRQLHIRYVQVNPFPKIFAMQFSMRQESYSLLEAVSSSNAPTCA